MGKRKRIEWEAAHKLGQKLHDFTMDTSLRDWKTEDEMVDDIFDEIFIPLLCDKDFGSANRTSWMHSQIKRRIEGALTNAEFEFFACDEVKTKQFEKRCRRLADRVVDRAMRSGEEMVRAEVAYRLTKRLHRFAAECEEVRRPEDLVLLPVANDIFDEIFEPLLPDEMGPNTLTGISITATIVPYIEKALADVRESDGGTKAAATQLANRGIEIIQREEAVR